MHRTPALFFAASNPSRFHTTRHLRSSSPPIVQISNGTFYRQHPSFRPAAGQEETPNPALFPGLTFSIPSSSSPDEHWAILSPSSTLRTAFLEILRGQWLCFPPTARSFPYLLSSESRQKNGGKGRSPEKAIEYVGFDVERRAFGGAYLSARYESRVESTDFTLSRYLTGITSMNPGEEMIRERTPDQNVMLQVVRDLELEPLFEKPVSTLSNGQSRRARIGKSLLARPELLCLDAPFIGLDPFVSKHISQLLHRLAAASAPRIVLSLRPQDEIPEWITHIVYASEGELESFLIGPKEEIVGRLPSRHWQTNAKVEEEANKASVLSRDGYEKFDASIGAGKSTGEAMVEMEGVRIRYGENAVLGDWEQEVDHGIYKDGLWWTVRRGQRWGIFGANGSGKTTLLALVSSDHPQTYSAPVKLFQRSRLPEPGVPGITIFDIQSRIGHSSPEVHALFPKNLSVRRTLETAWSDTPITKPRLDEDGKRRIDACLRWFKDELKPSAANPETHESSESLVWATSLNFGELTFSAQRVLLFLRATISNPDIVILDEAFSGMDEFVRDKCLLFLSRGESMSLDYQDSNSTLKPIESEMAKKRTVIVPGLQEHQALLCVSHSEQEVPGCIRDWVRLPESGEKQPPRFGKWDGPLELERRRWDEVWA